MPFAKRKPPLTGGFLLANKLRRLLNCRLHLGKIPNLEKQP
jgi:hypothetical protein